MRSKPAQGNALGWRIKTTTSPEGAAPSRAPHFVPPLQGCTVFQFLSQGAALGWLVAGPLALYRDIRFAHCGENIAWRGARNETGGEAMKKKAKRNLAAPPLRTFNLHARFTPNGPEANDLCEKAGIDIPLTIWDIDFASKTIGLLESRSQDAAAIL